MIVFFQELILNIAPPNLIRLIKMNIKPHKRIILPLDVSDAKSATDIASQLHEHIGVLKIGLQLYTSTDSNILSLGQELGLQIFLDLKLHDIPNTVAKTVESVSKHNIDFLTVHASGGKEMLEEAVKAAPPNLTLLAVTVLTSLSDRAVRDTFLTNSSAGSLALNLAQQAWDAGIRGFVCSPHEVYVLRQKLGPEAILVVPGVRPAGSAINDQARVATPADAIKDGANYIVIGRPILTAENRIAATKQIIEEIQLVAAKQIIEEMQHNI
jgi:orotidine-5'-phosphate decarboxylase